ncbi:hypothetical protein ASPFODRAFT_714064 [Aspergillus luchuensis CBS 106.47]|uniref:Uncharacterized protein n=1 Tax=Aspergillus luchuensis (strain CBS 106.47) TaxID=1137211 RepID=A0A1M3SYU2_ASPLC|nr:hypothetical protein ASPFODRAFT_714064 [Aspergillus luchuensis CBS 106.47]
MTFRIALWMDKARTKRVISPSLVRTLGHLYALGRPELVVIGNKGYRWATYWLVTCAQNGRSPLSRACPLQIREVAAVFYLGEYCLIEDQAVMLVAMGFPDSALSESPHS